MVQLTEKIVLGRARTADLNGVKTLNCWGSDFTDVSVLKSLPNVEVINASVNQIEHLEAFSSCHNLKELYLRKNNIKNIEELCYLADLKNLRFLWLSGNPFSESLSDEEYRLAVIKRLPQVQKLDNTAVTSIEMQRALQLHLESTDNDVDAENIAVSSVHSSYDVSTKASNVTLASESTKSQDECLSDLTTSSQDMLAESSQDVRVESPQDMNAESSTNIAGGGVEEKADREVVPEMTLEETNRLRLQLGLNPISVAKYSASVSPQFKPPKRHKKHGGESNSHILNASLSLIEELNPNELVSLQDAVQRRLDLLLSQQLTELSPDLELLPS